MNVVLTWIILIISIIGLLSTIGILISSGIFAFGLLISLVGDVMIIVHCSDVLKHKCKK